MRSPILFYIVIALFPSVKAFSQQPPEFGTVDITELQMKECAFDKNASAVNLLKTAETKLQVQAYSDPKIHTQYRVRIKIFDEKAFDHASISIPYVDSRAVKINDIEAWIYNLDEAGNIVKTKLTKDQVFREKGKGKKGYNRVRFTFPGLTRGSVIEYRYNRVDKNSIYLKPWFFQDELPTIFSRISLNTPGVTDLQYHIVANNTVEKDSSVKKYAREEYNEYTKVFTMHNVPAFKMESMMTSLKDNLQRIEFAVLPKSFYSFGLKLTIRTDRWSLYNSALLRASYFGGQFDAPVPGTEQFVDSVKALQDTIEKIKCVYQFVKNTVTWNGEQTYYADNINDCLKDKTGSSAEMNILMFNLLRKVGVASYPVLVSTRDNGMLDETFPSMSQFNGVDILAINKGIIYVIDATQKNLPFNYTPLNVLNAKAFIVDWSASQWITINDNRALMKTALSFYTVVDSSGQLNGQGNLIFTGVAKAEKLRQEQKSEADKDDSKEMVDNNQDILKIDTVETVSQNENTDTLIEKIKFHNALSNTGPLYFVNPYMFSMFKKNPFKDSTRQSDIDFGCIQSYYTTINVILPGNFEIAEMPKSITIRLADSSIMFKRELFSAEKQILIRNAFIINRANFGREEYSAVKSFFDKIYALINEQIILKKTDE